VQARADGFSFYRKLLEFVRPCWPEVAGIFLLAVLSTPLALLLPLPLKIAVDSVLGSQPLPHFIAVLAPAKAQATAWGRLLIAAGLLLAISTVMSLQSLASWLLQTYTGEKLVLDLRKRLFWHVQRLSLHFHERLGAKDTAYRIEHDAPSIQYIVVQGVVPFFTAILTLIAMIYVTARIDWQLAVIAVALSPVLAFLARGSSRRTRTGWTRVRELDSSAMLVMHEALSGARAVKAFGQEQQEDRRFLRKSAQRMREQLRLASVQAGFHVLIGFTIALGTTAALAIGIMQVHAHVLTVGELLLVMAYMGQLNEPLRLMSTKVPEMQSWCASAERAFALLDEEPEALERSGATALRTVSGAVSFRNVCFGYRREEPVLDDISFDIPAGARVGLVGPSGSGKSTMVNLLMRFYDPNRGQVLLDGHDIREFRLADLRDQFSLVLQQPILFTTTLAGNIAYSRPGASREEIIAAAQAANAHEFILGLPQRYDTPIGERGVQLSGGEAQRVALARAFLKQAPILIMDEPTSSVDVVTEAAIIEATESLMRGRTTFIIAHRLTTIENCDLLIVLRNGRAVVSSGGARKAQELMFRNLWSSALPQMG
jgi:ATP-binding cassette subfamily B protein